MNQQYDNTNSGALFRNDKAGNEKRPDYKGSLNIDGVDYWLSAWLRDKKDGSGKYMSLKAERKEQPQHAPPQRQAAPPAPAIDLEDCDDIPF
jgi:hypothetical protein